MFKKKQKKKDLETVADKTNGSSEKIEELKETDAKNHQKHDENEIINENSKDKLSEDNEENIEYKNYTSWVAIFLLLLFTGIITGGIWFYMNFIFEMPEPTIATINTEALEEVTKEYEPMDIVTTKFINHNPEFDIEDLKAQSYLYSRDHVLYISLFSGLGDPIGLSEDTLNTLIQRVAKNYTNPNLRSVQLIKNLHMVGNSIFVTEPDFSTFRSTLLSKTKKQYSISDEAIGWLIFLETEWGKQFQYSKIYGNSSDLEFALYRSLGSIMIHSATKQASEWLSLEDRTKSLTGEYVMATALMNLSQVLWNDSLSGMEEANPFQDKENAAIFRNEARRIFNNAPTPKNARGMAIASTMMGIYGSQDIEAREEIIERLEYMNQQLSFYTPQTIADKSWAIITYIEIGKRLNDPDITDKGWEVYEKKLRRLYLPDTGLFYEQDVYALDEITALLQMLNRISEVGGQYWDQREINKFKLEVFESLVNQAKIQRSHFPIETFTIPENLFSEEWSFYDTIKEVSIAGGKLGKPPITGHKVWNKDGRWMMFDDKYVAEDGLYFSYVLMTMSSDYFSDVRNWSNASTAKAKIIK